MDASAVEHPVVGPAVVEQSAGEPSTVEGRAAGSADPHPARRPRWPGRVALATGILTPVLVTAGILAAEADAFLAGWWLALTALGTSLLAVLAGIAAVAGRWGRAAGVAGILLGIVANPLVLTWGLDFLGGL